MNVEMVEYDRFIGSGESSALNPCIGKARLCPQSHHLGARKGARRKNELEKRQRGHLVLHRVRRFLFQC